jgi:hypothetical protein
VESSLVFEREYVRICEKILGVSGRPSDACRGLGMFESLQDVTQDYIRVSHRRQEPPGHSMFAEHIVPLGSNRSFLPLPSCDTKRSVSQHTKYM